MMSTKGCSDKQSNILQACGDQVSQSLQTPPNYGEYDFYGGPASLVQTTTNGLFDNDNGMTNMHIIIIEK